MPGQAAMAQAAKQMADKASGTAAALTPLGAIPATAPSAPNTDDVRKQINELGEFFKGHVESQAAPLIDRQQLRDKDLPAHERGRYVQELLERSKGATPLTVTSDLSRALDRMSQTDPVKAEELINSPQMVALQKDTRRALVDIGNTLVHIGRLEASGTPSKSVETRIKGLESNIYSTLERIASKENKLIRELAPDREERSRLLDRPVIEKTPAEIAVIQAQLKAEAEQQRAEREQSIKVIAAWHKLGPMHGSTDQEKSAALKRQLSPEKTDFAPTSIYKMDQAEFEANQRMIRQRPEAIDGQPADVRAAYERRAKLNAEGAERAKQIHEATESIINKSTERRAKAEELFDKIGAVYKQLHDPKFAGVAAQNEQKLRSELLNISAEDREQLSQVIKAVASDRKSKGGPICERLLLDPTGATLLEPGKLSKAYYNMLRSTSEDQAEQVKEAVQQSINRLDRQVRDELLHFVERSFDPQTPEQRVIGQALKTMLSQDDRLSAVRRVADGTTLAA